MRGDSSQTQAGPPRALLQDEDDDLLPRGADGAADADLPRALRDVVGEHSVDPEDGGYVVHCPALPGCYSQGDTRAESLDSIREAIETYIESLRIDKLPIPGAELDASTLQLLLAVLAGWLDRREQDHLGRRQLRATDRGTAPASDDRDVCRALPLGAQSPRP